MRQQGWNGRDQCADARGNPDRDSENVIGEERSRGEKARASAQVESRDGVGAAAVWICGNGLAIREVHDDEQRDDGGTDGDEIANAEKTEGNQKAEACFGPVRGRAERIETKDGDAFCGADLLGALVSGLDGFADD